MEVRKIVFLLAAFLLLSVPSCAAEGNVYLAMNPDTTFCIRENLGSQGTGLYTITIDDPGFPDDPWVDTHSASFYTGPDNPIIVPICFNTDGRRRRTEVTLGYSLATPRKNTTKSYGICVSNFEDYDEGIMEEDPCRAIISDMQTFTFDIDLPERQASPGEIVEFNLLLSSDFPMDIELEKKSGTKIDIDETVLKMPGEYTVKMSLTSPDEEGDYPFVITAKRSGCDSPECSIDASGEVFVTEAVTRNDFDVSLQPKNKNVVGLKPVSYYVTIKNYGNTQNFKLSLDTGDGLTNNLKETVVKVGKGSKESYRFTATPTSQDSKIHKIELTVENEAGISKAADAILTVDEVLSNINTAAENGIITDSKAGELADAYDSGSGTEKWDFMDSGSDNSGNPEEAEEQPFDFTFLAMIVAVIAAVAVASFYVYKKSRVTQEVDSRYFQ